MDIMRRRLKRAVSAALAASLTVALAAGGPQKRADAAEAFTASLVQNNSLIFEGDENGVVGTPLTIDPTQSGEYTITATAQGDVDDLLTEAKYIGIETSLEALPTDFSMEGVSIKVDDAEYDWSGASLYTLSGGVRLGVVNNYVGPKNAEEFALANPLCRNVNGTWVSKEPVPVYAKQIVTFTFKVTAGAKEPADPSGNKDGANPVKRLKAAKGSVSVKVGKMTKVEVAITAEDNEKKTTDDVTATVSNKKIAKASVSAVKPGKATIKIKGVKKGAAKLTVKAGKKKAVIKIKVK